MPGDRTASMALSDQAKYYDDEVTRGATSGLFICGTQRIDWALRWGSWTRPTWKKIADKVNYSESRVKQVAGAAILRLAMTSDQVVFPGMVR